MRTDWEQSKRKDLRGCKKCKKKMMDNMKLIRKAKKK